MSKAYKVLEMTLFANWASYPAFSEVCALEMDSKLTISENGTFLQCWWECKLMQPPQKTVWRFFRKLKKKKKKNAVLPSNPTPGHESESEVAQLCPTLCHPMDCSLPGSSVHGIFQAKILEWVATSFSRGSS